MYATLEAKAATRTTAQLLAAHKVLDDKAGPLTNEESAAAIAMANVIEQRHDLIHALDDIFADEAYDGTYNDTLKLALEQV